MANFYGLGRTNYVTVKDVDAVRAWFEQIEVDVDIFEQQDGKIALSGYSSSDNGDLPSWFQEEDGTERDDFIEEFARRFLVDGEVLIYMAAGSEKARYCSGVAQALTNTGESVYVSLDEIYDRAVEAFGVPRTKITDASY